MVRTISVRDSLDRMLHVVEIADLDQNEMLAWASSVETAHGLEVEELFVRPAYQGVGNGRDLAQALNELNAARKLPVRCWVPHADWTGAPTRAQSAIFRRLGIRPNPVPERWAATVADTPARTRPA